jgi:hypothetical protein
MKLPGRAWLEFRIQKSSNRNCLSVKAHYQTRGLWGKLYWYLFLPFHIFIFKNLIQQIERISDEAQLEPKTSTTTSPL